MDSDAILLGAVEDQGGKASLRKGLKEVFKNKRG